MQKVDQGLISTLEKNKREKAEKIVAIFMALYPSFNKAIKSEETFELIVKNWMKGIEGLDNEQIKLAIDKCRNDESYIPTIARFRFLAFGLIDTSVAFELAKKEDFQHPIIYYARNKIHDWKYLDENNLYSRFTRIYATLCEDVLKGIKFCMPQRDSSRMINVESGDLTNVQYKNWLIEQYGQEAWDNHFAKNFEKI